jgi:hypothetical protein
VVVTDGVAELHLKQLFTNVLPKGALALSSVNEEEEEKKTSIAVIEDSYNGK